MFNTLFSPLSKILGKILAPNKMPKSQRQILSWILIFTMIVLVLFGATVTATVMLINAIR